MSCTGSLHLRHLPHRAESSKACSARTHGMHPRWRHKMMTPLSFLPHLGQNPPVSSPLSYVRLANLWRLASKLRSGLDAAVYLSNIPASSASDLNFFSSFRYLFRIEVATRLDTTATLVHWWLCPKNRLDLQFEMVYN